MRPPAHATAHKGDRSGMCSPSHLLICPTVSEHLPHAQLWEWQQDFCSDLGRQTFQTWYHAHKAPREKEGAEREPEMAGFALILARWL